MLIENCPIFQFIINHVQDQREHATGQGEADHEVEEEDVLDDGQLRPDDVPGDAGDGHRVRGNVADGGNGDQDQGLGQEAEVGVLQSVQPRHTGVLEVGDGEAAQQYLTPLLVQVIGCLIQKKMVSLHSSSKHDVQEYVQRKECKRQNFEEHKYYRKGSNFENGVEKKYWQVLQNVPDVDFASGM